MSGSGVIAKRRSPLRSPAFWRLWLGLSVSYAGDQFTAIALLWFTLQLTGSGVAIGLVLLCFQAPGMLTGPLLGALLDRWQPRIVMGLDNCARALLIGAIPILAQERVLHLWHIYALALLAGALSPATDAGMRVITPSLVAPESLDRANALVSTSLQFAALFGPALAGVMVAAVGGAWALLVDAGSFLLMGALAFTLPSVSRPPVSAREPGAPRLGALLGGFHEIISRKELRLLTALSLLFFFSYGPLETALPVYAARDLRVRAAGYGLLWTGFGAGALLGALLTGFVARRFRPGLTQPLITILWGGFLVPLMFTRSLPVALLCLGLGGLSWAPYTPIEASLMQRLIPESKRGQVFGARLAMTTAAAPLGALCGGLLLGMVPAPVVIGISGVACVVAGGVAFLSPAMRALGAGATEVGGA